MTQTKLAIIGSGPSGYTAAIYAGRAKLAPLMLSGIKNGGQLMWTTEIENFPGFPEGKAGIKLMQEMRQQATRFGTTIIDTYVSAVDFSSQPFKLWTNLPDGFDPMQFENMSQSDFAAFETAVKQQPAEIEAEAVIISTGAASRMLGMPGEQKFLGRGVSTCAVCDAAFYQNKDTFVIGGGDSAMEDALALTKFAKSVTIVHRRDSFKASKIMQERVLNHPKVKVRWNSQPVEVVGQQKVTGIRIADAQDPTAVRELPADGIFLAIGHMPLTQIFQNKVQLDSQGYVVTRMSVSKLGTQAASTHLDERGLVAYPTMTSIEGVFAAGDVVDVRYKQAITAAGMGCSAALDAERWLETK